MAKVRIHPGACGLTTTVEVVKKDGKTYSVTVLSECEMVEKLGREVPELHMMDAFKRILDNPVYRAGSSCVRHVSCPVPCAILKTLEAAAGLAVARDVSITFIEAGEETEEVRERDAASERKH